MTRLEVSLFGNAQMLLDDKDLISTLLDDFVQVLNGQVTRRMIKCQVRAECILKALGDLKTNTLVLNRDQASLILAKGEVFAHYVGCQKSFHNRSELDSFIRSYASIDCRVNIFSIGAETEQRHVLKKGKFMAPGVLFPSCKDGKYWEKHVPGLTFSKEETQEAIIESLDRNSEASNEEDSN